MVAGVDDRDVGGVFDLYRADGSPEDSLAATTSVAGGVRSWVEGCGEKGTSKGGRSRRAWYPPQLPQLLGGARGWVLFAGGGRRQWNCGIGGLGRSM